MAAGGKRSQLSAETLLTTTHCRSPSPWLPSARATGAASREARAFEGLLEFMPPAGADGLTVLRDDFDYASDAAAGCGELPPFHFYFIQAGDQLIPATRGTVAS